MNVAIAHTMRGELHVHKDGCRDLSNPRKYVQNDDWTFEAATEKEVVCEIYPPDDFCYDADTDEFDTYAQDITFFPCTASLS